MAAKKDTGVVVKKLQNSKILKVKSTLYFRNRRYNSMEKRDRMINVRDDKGMAELGDTVSFLPTRKLSTTVSHCLVAVEKRLKERV
jgi:ribosomal protein S17